MDVHRAGEGMVDGDNHDQTHGDENRQHASHRNLREQILAAEEKREAHGQKRAGEEHTPYDVRDEPSCEVQPYSPSGRHIVELPKDFRHVRRASRPALTEGDRRGVQRIECVLGRRAFRFARHRGPFIFDGGFEVVGERGPHGYRLGLLALRVVKESRGRAGFVCDGGLRVVEFLPHDDDRKGEQHGVDNAYGREFESGDLVVLGQPSDADPLVNQGLRDHGQSGGSHHDQRDQKPQREARQEIRHSDLRVYATAVVLARALTGAVNRVKRVFRAAAVGQLGHGSGP
jgi:hypothetical protein